MTHYTLNNGHTVEQPPCLVCAEAIEALKPLARAGGPIPGFAAYRVSVDHKDGAAVFTLWRAQESIETCAVAWTPAGEAKLWPEIKALYLGLNDKHPPAMEPAIPPEKPGHLPWVCVVLLPAMVNQPPSDVGWFGDFERYLAWAIMKAQE